MRRLFAVAVALGLVSCSAPQDDSLFPLAKGHRWAYDITTEWENKVVEHEPRVIETLGSDSLAWPRLAAAQ